MVINDPNGNEGICISPRDLLAETDNYKLYLGRGENSADALLCRIVKSKAQNGIMYAEKKLLDELSELSQNLEQERISKQGDDGRKIHYDWLFPVCEQSFSCDATDNRRINTFSVLDASWDKFVPFLKLKNDTKVDAKSAAWVLGRFLKLQAFLDESENCRSLDFNPDMVLIAPKQHRVVYVGWFDELLHGGDRSYSHCDLISKLNIDRMFDATLSWVEKNDTEGEDEFMSWLKRFTGYFNNGLEAHVAYYEFLDALWGKGYHPFTFNKDGVWKNVDNFV